MSQNARGLASLGRARLRDGHRLRREVDADHVRAKFRERETVPTDVALKMTDSSGAQITEFASLEGKKAFPGRAARRVG